MEQGRLVFDEQIEVFRSPRGRKLLFHTRTGTNDHNILQSVCHEDEYRLAQYSPTGVALDIGAHIGAVAIALAVDNPGLRVIAVEPVADNLRLLRANIAANGVEDRIGVFPVAVGAPIEEWTQLHHSFRGDEHAQHHSYIGTTENGNEDIAEPWRLGSDHDVERVQTVSYAELSTKDVSFVKVDCEGAEYAFFQDRAIDNVPVIVGEWHNVPYQGRIAQQTDIAALLPKHRVTFFGPTEGPGGFEAKL